MRQIPVLLMLGLLAVSLVARGPRAQTETSAFPHEKHANLFPNCTACHAGVEAGDLARTYTVTEQECARCHDGTKLNAVSWSPPVRGATNTRFDHAEHLEQPDFTCATCHNNGPEPMQVIAVSREACLDCHQVTNHFSAETACATCHVPLVEATGLSAERIGRFPQPDNHASESFAHDHGGAAEASIEQCAICHSRDLCESCHLNADQVASIGVLAPDDRVHALVASRPGSWPEPVSHESSNWLTGDHGMAAVASAQDCANCHVQSSCDQCHGRIPPTGREALPVAREGGPTGVHLPDAHPPLHVPGFDAEHAVTAASGAFDCMSCHTNGYCEDCHYGATRPSFHAENYMMRHGADANARDQNCADCHSQEVFCRSCHLETGLAPTDPVNASYHQTYGGYWLIAHGQMARQNMDDCASCHQQNDCLKCHSQLGWGVNPHGPGFDAARLADKSPQMCATCHISGPK